MIISPTPKSILPMLGCFRTAITIISPTPQKTVGDITEFLSSDYHHLSCSQKQAADFTVFMTVFIVTTPTPESALQISQSNSD